MEERNEGAINLEYFITKSIALKRPLFALLSFGIIKNIINILQFNSTLLTHTEEIE